MHSYRFMVTGKVQGVWYRKTISERANAAGFCGYVKNMEDGSVEVCTALDDDDFAEFVAILEEGSPKSVVENIRQEVIDEVFKGVFEVRY